MVNGAPPPSAAVPTASSERNIKHTHTHTNSTVSASNAFDDALSAWPKTARVLWFIVERNMFR